MVPASFGASRDEASVRSVVSRAYYAAFNCAKAYVFAKGWTLRRRKIPHGDVWALFQHRERTQAERDVGDVGMSLMDDRQEADYEPTAPQCSQKVCDNALKAARQILENLNVLPSPATPTSAQPQPRNPPG